MRTAGAPSPKRGFTLIELMIVIAIIAIIAAIAIPGLLSSQRASNERNASTSLKTLTSAEADFRANDRDWNHVNDFWTGDVKGLYTMTSAAVASNAGGTTDPPIKLIELSIASADGDGGLVGAGGENMALSNFALSAAKAGYWYQALITDAALGSTAEATYKLDTGGTPNMASCHNTAKFGFIAYPDSQSAGKYCFVVNENNTIFRSATSGTVKAGTSNPPGLLAITSYQNFPSDANLKSYWSKLD
jgi:prepilin-type N-terminal cleavage/methylation domain-containing protein